MIFTSTAVNILAIDLVDGLALGGVTIDPKTGAKPTTGFAVAARGAPTIGISAEAASIRGAEAEYTTLPTVKPDFRWRMRRVAEAKYTTPPTTAQVRSWIDRDARPLVQDSIARGYRPHLRAWVDENGTTCLDVFTVVDDLDTALSLCRLWREKTVFNLATNETFSIN